MLEPLTPGLFIRAFIGALLTAAPIFFYSLIMAAFYPAEVTGYMQQFGLISAFILSYKFLEDTFWLLKEAFDHFQHWQQRQHSQADDGPQPPATG